MERGKEKANTKLLCYPAQLATRLEGMMYSCVSVAGKVIDVAWIDTTAFTCHYLY
jgi:hypothetical protein